MGVLRRNKGVDHTLLSLKCVVMRLTPTQFLVALDTDSQWDQHNMLFESLALKSLQPDQYHELPQIQYHNYQIRNNASHRNQPQHQSHTHRTLIDQSRNLSLDNQKGRFARNPSRYKVAGSNRGIAERSAAASDGGTVAKAGTGNAFPRPRCSYVSGLLAVSWLCLPLGQQYRHYRRLIPIRSSTLK